MSTATKIRGIAKSKGNDRPARANHVIKVVMAAETTSGWICTKDFALSTFSWFSNTAMTVKIKGRFIDEEGDAVSGSESYVGDKDGVHFEIDMSNGDASLGSSIPLDVAATFDELSFEFSISNSETFYLGLAG